jgi:glycosyltransferase involved in cell wall biosynthesis
LRLAVDRSDAVVALSRTEAQWHRHSLGVLEDRSRVIPNGVDPFAFPFAERRPPTVGPWRLLFVGQLQPFKGVDVLLRAVALLTDDEDVVLDLIYHVDAAEPELLRRRAELGLESRVRFLGPRSQKSLAREYQRANMLVLPSLEVEQLPSVVTEAMLSGCPVVASDVGSLREQLDGAGVVVPRGDPGALAAGIRAMMREYERYCDCALRARESALRRFSVGAMVNAHEHLYQELLHSDVPVRRHVGGPLFRTQLWRGATATWITLKHS